jgi:hypothetical protein
MVAHPTNVKGKSTSMRIHGHHIRLPPKHYTGVPNWRERWTSGDYKRLMSWQFAWGFLRHSFEYLDNWRYNIASRQMKDKGLIPPTDESEWEQFFHLRYKLDPALNAFDITENPFSSARDQRRLRIYRGPREVNVVLSPNQVIVIVDLSWPLAAQLDAAKRHLAPRSMTSRRRLRNDKYAEYVCALDGKAAGPSWAEIGRVLHPNLSAKTRSDKVKNYLRAGASLGSDGYWSIARG